MCSFSDFIKSTLHHHDGQAPKPSFVTQAFTAACLLRDHTYEINTTTQAAICCGVAPSYVAAATILLEAKDTVLINAMLDGHEPLLRAARNARNCAQLITALEAASPDDLITLARTIGAKVPDRAIAPAL